MIDTKKPNPEFAAYGSQRMQWLDDYREEFASSTPAHDVTRDYGGRRVIDHTGWYVDPIHQSADETVHGVVLTVETPCQACAGVEDTEENNYGRDCETCGGDKVTREYMAGISDPYNDDAVMIDREDTFTDEVEAARAADALAERYAEQEREYRAGEECKAQIEAAIDTIRECRKSHSALQLERSLDIYKCETFAAATIAAAHEQRASLRYSVHKAAERVKLLRREPWHAVEY
jgi:hypothetical protein